MSESRIDEVLDHNMQSLFRGSPEAVEEWLTTSVIRPSKLKVRVGDTDQVISPSSYIMDNLKTPPQVTKRQAVKALVSEAMIDGGHILRSDEITSRIMKILREE